MKLPHTKRPLVTAAPPFSLLLRCFLWRCVHVPILPTIDYCCPSIVHEGTNNDAWCLDAARFSANGGCGWLRRPGWQAANPSTVLGVGSAVHPDKMSSGEKKYLRVLPLRAIVSKKVSHASSANHHASSANPVYAYAEHARKHMLWGMLCPGWVGVGGGCKART